MCHSFNKYIYQTVTGLSNFSPVLPSYISILPSFGKFKAFNFDWKTSISLSSHHAFFNSYLSTSFNAHKNNLSISSVPNPENNGTAKFISKALAIRPS
jgi:hypothetical protein